MYSGGEDVEACSRNEIADQDLPYEVYALENPEVGVMSQTHRRARVGKRMSRLLAARGGIDDERKDVEFARRAWGDVKLPRRRTSLWFDSNPVPMEEDATSEEYDDYATEERSSPPAAADNATSAAVAEANEADSAETRSFAQLPRESWALRALAGVQQLLRPKVHQPLPTNLLSSTSAPISTNRGVAAWSSGEFSNEDYPSSSSPLSSPQNTPPFSFALLHPTSVPPIAPTALSRRQSSTWPPEKLSSMCPTIVSLSSISSLSSFSPKDSYIGDNQMPPTPPLAKYIDDGGGETFDMSTLDALPPGCELGDGVGGEGVIMRPRLHHSATVIFLHGIGHGVEHWANTLSQLRMPHVKFVLPSAPMRRVSLMALSSTQRAWFDITALSDRSPEDRDGVLSAVSRVKRLVRAERERGIPFERIVLAGFSQGAAVALSALMRLDIALAGAVCIGSWLPLREDYPECSTVSSRGCKTRVLLLHGARDYKVRSSWSRAGANTLRMCGAHVSYVEFRRLGHNVSAEVMDSLAMFLARTIPPTFSDYKSSSSSSVWMKCNSERSSASAAPSTDILAQRRSTSAGNASLPSVLASTSKLRRWAMLLPHGKKKADVDGDFTRTKSRAHFGCIR